MIASTFSSMCTLILPPLSLHPSLVVTGDSGGQVRFLDSDLKLLHWYEHTSKLGPLASVSFAYAPKLNMVKER